MADLLSSWLFSIVEHADSDTPALMSALSSKVQRITKLKGQFLFYSGDTADFYSLINGKVSLLEPKAFKAKKSSTRLNCRDFILDKLRRSNLEAQLAQLEDRIDFLEIETTLDEHVVVELVKCEAIAPGEHFGSRSIGKTTLQSMSAVCEDDCEMLCLPAKDAEEVLTAVEHRRLHKLCKALQPLPAFANWAWQDLFNLAKSCMKVPYNQGDIVFHERERPEHVFIVLSGEFEFTKLLPSKQVKANSLGVRQKIVYREKLVRSIAALHLYRQLGLW